MTARPKARSCCRSLAGIAGSNTAGGIDVCMLLGRAFCDEPIPRRGQSYWGRARARVYMYVTRCDQVQRNPVHLQWLCRRVQAKKERKLRRKQRRFLKLKQLYWNIHVKGSSYRIWWLWSMALWQIQRIWHYTGCPRRKGPNFGRVFLRSNYTDITQNTYIQS